MFLELGVEFTALDPSPEDVRYAVAARSAGAARMRGLTVREEAAEKIAAVRGAPALHAPSWPARGNAPGPLQRDVLAPHYTRLLGLHAGVRVVQDDRNEITLGDVNAAIPAAIAKHTIQSDYLKATRSTRSDNLYPQVLLACALASKNQLGYFTAGAIRDPLEVIAKRRLDIPAFARHLKQFLAPERGAVLQREGQPRPYFYRFSDPIMQPFVVLNGLSEGLISDEELAALRPDVAPSEDGPSTRRPLF